MLDWPKNMEAYWESATQAAGLTYETGCGIETEFIPVTQEPVYILGKSYSALHEREEAYRDIYSRIWMTYRKGFPPIDSPSGPTSDTGWGCMHRCGQMMLAQAMVNVHLGRDWRWCRTDKNTIYEKIISMFDDKKNSMFSIHHIAQMGVSEGKKVGTWFGPNTVAQVFKKLAVYDRWTNLAIHVALEDGVIIDEIKTLCRTTLQSTHTTIPPLNQLVPPSTHKREDQKPSTLSGSHSNIGEVVLYPSLASDIFSTPVPMSNDLDDDCVEISLPPGSSINQTSSSTLSSAHSGASQTNTKKPAIFHHPNSEMGWKPLLLVIPLRLGLAELNDCYIPAIKKIFTLPQCVGIIGGRPSHALWFIGAVEDSLLYLDPHTTQTATATIQDDTYHCTRPGRIAISKVDPSLAVGFLCPTESSLGDLCESLCRRVLGPARDPLFEIHQRRPAHLPPICGLTEHPAHTKHLDFLNNADNCYDSEEDFELI